MNLKYGVIGTGALGGYYGGQLAKSGKDVHFLFNSDFQHVVRNGLRVDSIKGDFHLNNINAYNSADNMPACDVVLVCLKTTNNNLLKELLPPVLHEKSVVILIQNGLGNEEDLEQQIPDIEIAGSLAFICSAKVGPGHISHTDLGRLVIAPYNTKQTELLGKVGSDFQESEVPCQLTDDLKLARWQKLVWNIAYNGLAVVLNTLTDKIMKNASTRQLAFDLMLEVVKGANQCSVPLKEEFAHKMMEVTDGMDPYAPSMKLDFDYKRPMEIEYIYTNPVQTAAKAGYEMKKTSMIEQQLRFIQEERMNQK